MNSYSQSKLFCIFFLLGIFLNLIFDIFRGIRRSIKFTNLLVLIQDIIFLSISGFLFFRTLLIFSNGEIRLYMLFALILGITIYSLTISKQCVIIISLIVKGLLKFLNFIINIIFLPYKFINKHFLKKIKGKLRKT